MQTFNISDTDLIKNKNIFKEFWYLKIEYYKNLFIKSIVFTYKVVKKDIDVIIPTKILKPVNNTNKTKFSFKGWNLPNTMDLFTWGELMSFTDDSFKLLKHNSDLVTNLTKNDTFFKFDIDSSK